MLESSNSDVDDSPLDECCSVLVMPVRLTSTKSGRWRKGAQCLGPGRAEKEDVKTRDNSGEHQIDDVVAFDESCSKGSADGVESTESRRRCDRELCFHPVTSCCAGRAQPVRPRNKRSSPRQRRERSRARTQSYAGTAVGRSTDTQRRHEAIALERDRPPAFAEGRPSARN